ncbi:MAG: hypothetical protein ACP5G7_05130 [Anaerolineae bacterium]
MDWDQYGQHDIPAPSAERVLVAIVPRLQDWALVVNERWYRIPLAKAPERVGAEYLAFYMPARFGELGCSIRYYAPIERYRLVRRRELLPDQPDHPRSDERYLKLEIGSLRELPHPVPAAKLRRVTFIPTTLDRLLVAQEINDLWLRETAKDRLWQALQERGVEAYRDHVLLTDEGHHVVDVAVPADRGGLAIHCGDDTIAEAAVVYDLGDATPAAWTWLCIPGVEILRDTPASVERVLRALVQLREYGAPKPRHRIYWV